MGNTLLASLQAHYHLLLAVYAAIGIAAVTTIGKYVLQATVPAIAKAAKLNADTYAAKMAKPNYAAVQKRHAKWGALFSLVAFVGVLPFCLTAQTQGVWRVLRDVFIILMVYDFFYYLTHRFLFHDSSLGVGPLKWMHAVHHRQLNPCRMDSSYLHPLESAIGLGLYVACILGLSMVMGGFSVVTIVVTFLAFTQINLHNHDLWEADKFPFKYFNYLSDMHHNHHARFTGGNYATISLLYDWMFGTIDYGDAGRGKARVEAKAEAKG